MRCLTCGGALLLLAAGCSRPRVPGQQSEKAAAPFSQTQTSAARQPDSPQLSALVKQIVASAHRNGSVVYRVECGPERTLEEQSLAPPLPKVEPMKEALDQLQRSYPGLKWDDSATGVRVFDTGVRARLLKVHIPEFTVVEDRDAETALAALWRTPEVIRYMAAHDLRFAPNAPAAQRERNRGVVVVHMKNATVEQIVQRIAASYSNRGSRFWSYRECRNGAETLFEIKIL